jgi:FdhD protein
VREHRADRDPLDREDRLVTEEPLEVRCAWPGSPPRRVGVTMRTPGHDFELAVGYLAAEGVLVGADDLRTVAYCTDQDLPPDQEYNVVTVTLAGPPRRLPGGRYDGVAAATSACGVCGAQSIDDVLGLTHVAAAHRWDGLVVSPEVVRAVPARLREAQRLFDSTGGLHGAGLLDERGELRVAREDVGRHNAVDKVVGAEVLAGRSPAAPVLAVSGRLGFEIVQKAAAAGVGVVVAVGAPSSLAVELATSAGICTVGFAGPERFVTYTVADRVGV